MKPITIASIEAGCATERGPTTRPLMRTNSIAKRMPRRVPIDDEDERVVPPVSSPTEELTTMPS